MGRQYGFLLKFQIESYYQKAMNEHPPWGGNWSRADVEEFARRNYKNYPERAKEIFNGMAETSGLSIDQLILIDQYTELPTGTCALALVPHCRFVEMLLT